MTNKAYLSGDIVEFRIDFKNNTSTVANFVILQDVLPNTLQFVSSEIYGVTNPKYGSKTEQGQFVIEYSGFSLQAGQAGYMIIRGKLKVNYEQCIVNPTNFAFLYANQNNTPLTAQARFECGQITTNGASCANIITNTTSTSKSVEVSCV